MVVGTGLPETGSGIVFGTSTSLPFTLTLILSTGGGAGLVSSCSGGGHRSRSSLRTRRQFHLSCGSGALAGAALFVGRAPGDEFILELADEALHRPGAGFAKGADRAPAGDVVGNPDQVIGVALAGLPRASAGAGPWPSRASLRGRACIGRSFRARRTPRCSPAPRRCPPNRPAR